MSVVVTPSGARGVTYPIPGRLIALLTRIPLTLQRLSGGRLKMHGQPLLLLTTVGARTGQPRTSMVSQFPQSDGSTLIVASFGGAAKHPSWYFNLAKHPDQVFIERNGRPDPSSRDLAVWTRARCGLATDCRVPPCACALSGDNNPSRRPPCRNGYGDV